MRSLAFSREMFLEKENRMLRGTTAITAIQKKLSSFRNLDTNSVSGCYLHIQLIYLLSLRAMFLSLYYFIRRRMDRWLEYLWYRPRTLIELEKRHWFFGTDETLHCCVHELLDSNYGTTVV